MKHLITFITANGERILASAPTGELLAEVARRAEIEISQPCGGQGRCGRCAVQVTEGGVRRRSTLRLTQEDIQAGYALACQAVVESDAVVSIPAQEKVERRLTTDRTAVEVAVPAGYRYPESQSLRRYALDLSPPSMDDQTDDWSRLQTGLRIQAEINSVTCSLAMMRRLGGILRGSDWKVTAILDHQPEGTTRLIDVIHGIQHENDPLWACAIDIGTTTVTVWLVDLVSGHVKAQAAEYNGQIARGEDVISRIIYASKNGAGQELQLKVVETINELIERACKRASARPEEIVKATVSGNSTMIHLLLNIPATSIRLSPFITAVNQPSLVTAGELGLSISPEATVDCLPGIASYVGADITAGVLSSGVDTTEKLTLFLDVGTNGETVLGNQDWLVSCACSAGPAFEGAGVVFGMRATTGAIEEVWINSETYEPTYRVIGAGKPGGICGSGLISLLAEMFLTGILDKAGNIKLTVDSPRVRQGEHGPEYVLAWGEQSLHGRDIVINRVDIDNLLRAKAAIYAGFSVLAEQVGVTLEDTEQVLIGGSFGKYINVEKAIQIGLLPDLPWEKFQFLGNTSVRGAYLGLVETSARKRLTEIAQRMTYIELSSDNTFYEAFMSAMFLPHTDLGKFPTVASALTKAQE